MATISVRNTSSTATVGFFVENSTGIFNVYTESYNTSEYTSLSSSSAGLRVAIVPTVNNKYVLYRNTTTENASAEIDEYHAVWRTTGDSSVFSVRSVTSASTANTVNIVDEHGTHGGTPSGTGLKFGTYGVVGVHNTSVSSGYTLSHYKITIAGTTAGVSGIQILCGINETYSGAGVYTTISGTDAVVSLGSSSGGTITIEAVYNTVTTYTVSFDARGGSGAPSSITGIVSGGSATIPSDIPIKTGYQFNGWSLTDGGTAQYQPGAVISNVTANITLYAVWGTVTTTKTITYYGNEPSGATVENVPSAGSVTSGNDYTISSDEPTCANYEFQGWSSTATGQVEYQPGDTIPNVTNDVNLYALWSGGSREWTIIGDSLAYDTEGSLTYDRTTGRLIYGKVVFSS